MVCWYTYVQLYWYSMDGSNTHNSACRDVPAAMPHTHHVPHTTTQCDGMALRFTEVRSNPPILLRSLYHTRLCLGCGLSRFPCP